MKMKKHFFYSATFVALTATALCFSQDANAAGFALTEQSVTGLGRAFAGAGIVGDDYSAIAYNPAGMTLLDSGMQVGAVTIWQHGEVKGSLSSLGSTQSSATSGSENVDIFSTIPHFFGQYKINDSFNVGLGIYVPFGLASDYPSDWFGSNQGILSSLQSVDFAPSISYRMNDNWSFGASFIARYGYLELTQNKYASTFYSEMEMDGWAYYGRFGVMYEHSEDTRFGVSYQSKSTDGSHTLKGDGSAIYTANGSLASSGPASVTTVLPEQWLLSAYTKHGKFGYSASAKYSRWEGFDTFDVYYNGSSVSAADYDWQNTWMVSVGLDYYHDEAWTFRGGLGYDESPYRSADNRTVKIPENDRFWMSVGLSYKIDEHKTIDFAYSHLYLPTYKAKNGEDLYTNVKYDINADILGIAFQYNF